MPAAIAKGSPFALTRMKRLVMDGASASLLDHIGATRAALAECFGSEDHAEGVAAFLERREARFTGRVETVGRPRDIARCGTRPARGRRLACGRRAP